MAHQGESTPHGMMTATAPTAPAPTAPAPTATPPELPSVSTAEMSLAIDKRTEASTTQRTIEPAGPHFLARAQQARHKRNFSENDRVLVQEDNENDTSEAAQYTQYVQYAQWARHKRNLSENDGIQVQERASKVEKDGESDISEPDDSLTLVDSLTLALYAANWKAQDHYMILGLSKYRYKATQDQVVLAYCKKVLNFEPDNTDAASLRRDDNMLMCIENAFDVLVDPVKRRQFDSIDVKANVEPPTKKQLANGNFYELWGAVFEAEARFSKTQPVPSFGDANSTQEEVEAFYDFWYNLDSWRSFEYLDDDVPDDNENRDQKRHMERKRASTHKKLKAEDNARLRHVVDQCIAGDERIKRFRKEAHAAKNKKRLEKNAAEQKAAEEAEAAREAEEKVKLEAAEKAKAERDAIKKAKEAAKNVVKKNKRVLKGSVKDANYFVDGDASAATMAAVLADIELVQAKIDADEMAALAGKLNGLKVTDEIKAVWKAEVARLVEAGKLGDGEAKTLA